MATTPVDPLDRLLTQAARATDAELDTPELGAALDRLPTLLAASERSPDRPQRRRRLLLVAAGGVGAVAFALPTAADWVGARTGVFGEPGLTETDTSEWLDTTSPEIADIARDLGAQYPLPPGGTYDDATLRLQGVGGLIQETGVENFMAWEAACQWDRAWLAADTAGDAAAAGEAVEVLASVSTWETLVASDGGGVIDHLTDVAEAARQGDRDVVEDHVQANCIAEAGPG